MFWLMLGAIEGILILWLVIEIWRAPLGYEDENGFHEIKKRELRNELHREIHSARHKFHRNAA